MKILDWLSGGLNLATGGQPDEQLSARVWRNAETGSLLWGIARSTINALFFWERDPSHCERSFLSELDRSRRYANQDGMSSWD
jgi:hypothetical protein